MHIFTAANNLTHIDEEILAMDDGSSFE